MRENIYRFNDTKMNFFMMKDIDKQCSIGTTVQQEFIAAVDQKSRQPNRKKKSSGWGEAIQEGGQ